MSRMSYSPHDSGANSVADVVEALRIGLNSFLELVNSRSQSLFALIRTYQLQTPRGHHPQSVSTLHQPDSQLL